MTRPLFVLSHDSLICDVSEVICDMTHWYKTYRTHWYVSHDSYWYMTSQKWYVTWLIDIRHTWLIDMWAMTHWYVTYVTHRMPLEVRGECQKAQSRDTCESCHIWMSHVTYEWVMSLTECLKRCETRAKEHNPEICTKQHFHLAHHCSCQGAGMFCAQCSVRDMTQSVIIIAQHAAAHCDIQ